MLNILNGGKHADNTVDFQEFMIQPWGFDNFGEALRAGVEIYHTLKGVLKDRRMSTAVGDEGGFAPNLKDNEDALRVIEEAVDKAGYSWGEQIFVALDPATSELWNEAAKDGQSGYKFFSSSQEILSSDDLIGIWAEWAGKYPIRSIEDGLAENDRVLLREPSPALVINPDEGKESEADREKAGPTIEPVSIAKDAVSATDAVPVAATE